MHFLYATATAGTDGARCGLYAVHPHRWHRSTAATATDIEHHRHGAIATAGTDGTRTESYKIKINNSLLLFTYFTLLLLKVNPKQIFLAM